MKVSLYVNRNDFDLFYRWVRQLSEGVLASPPVRYSHVKEDIEDPLRVSLDSSEYYLITDSQEDLMNIQSLHGPLNATYIPENFDDHLQRIKESLRIAEREGKSLELIYNALTIMRELPNITQSEAIILAERTIFYAS